eukprot:NODE_11918_length_271_cov_1.199074.p2 GENE.NODE_11918_length_271_cov_1.199074~~NODE_11918_length_271_cov_1.199074.p2  ORF type:complete len:89 (-),score=3.26 NODE_11918_length_271_cov_1.199074:4-270(-)
MMMMTMMNANHNYTTHDRFATAATASMILEVVVRPTSCRCRTRQTTRSTVERIHEHRELSADRTDDPNVAGASPCGSLEHVHWRGQRR